MSYSPLSIIEWRLLMKKIIIAFIAALTLGME